MLLRLALLVVFLPSLVAQSPLDGLYHKDWQVRNETARKILVDGSVSFEQLWGIGVDVGHGRNVDLPVDAFELGGGVGSVPASLQTRAPEKDPEEIALGGLKRMGVDRRYVIGFTNGIRAEEDLVAPWGTLRLARFLACKKAGKDARRLPALLSVFGSGPTEEVKRAVVAIGAAAIPSLEASLLGENTQEDAADCLWDLGEAGRQVLARTFLDSKHAARAVVVHRLQGWFAANPKLRAAVVAEAMAGTSQLAPCCLSLLSELELQPAELQRWVTYDALPARRQLAAWAAIQVRALNQGKSKSTARRAQLISLLPTLLKFQRDADGRVASWSFRALVELSLRDGEIDPFVAAATAALKAKRGFALLRWWERDLLEILAHGSPARPLAPELGVELRRLFEGTEPRNGRSTLLSRLFVGRRHPGVLLRVLGWVRDEASQKFLTERAVRVGVARRSAVAGLIHSGSLSPATAQALKTCFRARDLKLRFASMVAWLRLGGGPKELAALVRECESGPDPLFPENLLNLGFRSRQWLRFEFANKAPAWDVDMLAWFDRGGVRRQVALAYFKDHPRLPESVLRWCEEQLSVADDEGWDAARGLLRSTADQQAVLAMLRKTMKGSSANKIRVFDLANALPVAQRQFLAEAIGSLKGDARRRAILAMPEDEGAGDPFHEFWIGELAGDRPHRALRRLRQLGSERQGVVAAIHRHSEWFLRNGNTVALREALLILHGRLPR